MYCVFTALDFGLLNSHDGFREYLKYPKKKSKIAKYVNHVRFIFRHGFTKNYIKSFFMVSITGSAIKYYVNNLR